jgi:hypothetical protein
MGMLLSSELYDSPVPRGTGFNTLLSLAAVGNRAPGVASAEARRKTATEIFLDSPGKWPDSIRG